MTDFIELVGKTLKFYGASEHQFKLDSVVWEAVEDECDGYRSMLETVERKESDAIFFQTPIAEVRIESRESNSQDGYKLVDVIDGHVWLEFGTDNADDYYPYFIFSYQPKAA